MKFTEDTHMESNSVSITIKPRTQVVFATVLGNALEWFDFASYAFLAHLIGAHFFPKGDYVANLMSAFAVFGIGFISRPLGAVIFGRFGDVAGRKRALMLSMPLMGLGTIMVGATPSYAAIGYAAPILLVCGRLVQGFAAGGENGNAMTFLVEWAPRRLRAFYSSLQQCSTLAGTLLGSGCAALLTSSLSPADLGSWGWRLPFLFGGLLIAPSGLWLRRHVEETPKFERFVAGHNVPKSADKLLIMKSVGMSAAWIVSFYLYFVYLPSLLPMHAKLSPSQALWANSAGLATMMCAIPIFGRLSDKLGRKPLLSIAAFTSVFMPYLVFKILMNFPSEQTAVLLLATVGLLLGAFAGIVPATISEMFPTSTRTTGLSVSYGLATAVFGGFAPFISTWLISYTGSPISPAIYLIVAALISLVTILTLRETAFEELS